MKATRTLARTTMRTKHEVDPLLRGKPATRVTDYAAGKTPLPG